MTSVRKLIDDPSRAIGVLRELRRMVSADGFKQSGFRTEDGWPDFSPGIDPYDSILDMMATAPARRDAIRLLAEIVNGTGSRDIVDWLGKFGRTQDQVLTWIDKAIERAT